VDGACIERDRNNDPILLTGPRCLTVWRGWRNSLTKSPDWRIVRERIQLSA
jgi:hypothetical protein